MGDFRKLVAWRRAHAFGIRMHKAFRGRVANSSPGFRAQILTATKSIADSLAEGCAKGSRRALAAFADHAYSSLKEVENDLMKARDLGMLPVVLCDDLLRELDEVARPCYGLTQVPPDAD